jgi:hypothetical protein
LSQYLSDPALLVVGGVILLIVGLTVQCLIMLGKAQRALSEEAQYLTTANNALKRVSPQELVQQASPGAYLYNLCSQTGTFPATCLSARYLRRMAYLSKSRLLSEERALDLVQRWTEDKASYVRYVSGTLVFLALFGTVTSLWMSLRSLPNFSAEAPNLEKLNEVVRHMVPAFLVTMFGIGGTVIVSWRSNRYTQAQEAFIDEVEELTDVMLGVLLFPLPRPDQAVESLQHEMLRAATEMKRTLAGVSAALQQELASQFQQATGFLQELTASTLTFSEKVKQAGESLETAATTLSAAAANATAATKESLTTVGMIQNEGLKLLAALETGARTIGAAIQGIETKIGQLQPYYEAMNRQVAGIDKRLLDLDQTQQSVRDDMRAALQGWQAVSKSLVALKEMMQHTQMQAQLDIGKSREQTAKEHKAFLLALKDASGELAAQLVELSALEQRLHGEMRKRLAYVLGSDTPDGPTPVETLHAELNKFATETASMLDRLATQATTLPPPLPEPAATPASPDAAGPGDAGAHGRRARHRRWQNIQRSGQDGNGPADNNLPQTPIPVKKETPEASVSNSIQDRQAEHGRNRFRTLDRSTAPTLPTVPAKNDKEPS